MCVALDTPQGSVQTVGELRRLWPRLVPAPRYRQLDEEACLCQVDLEASARLNGWAVYWMDAEECVAWPLDVAGREGGAP